MHYNRSKSRDQSHGHIVTFNVSALKMLSVYFGPRPPSSSIWREVYRGAGALWSWWSQLAGWHVNH